jgi:microcystin-dependent protein
MSPLLGEIRRFARATLPADWSICDGAVLPIGAHQPLFSLVGWRFGGDGWTTFRLPALRSPSAALTYGIAVRGIYPTREEEGAMSGDGYVGEIRLFSGEYAPPGWILCDGRTLPIAEPYLELFEVIGTTWGCGVDQFAVPDLRDEAQATSTVGRLTYIIAVAGDLPE